MIAPSASGPEVSATEVRRVLAAVLASEPFRDSPQLRAFLTFVVEETLGGRGADIKGYTIATMALGRPANFDPQTDPIVRVQAGRVRQALTEAAAALPDEPIQIVLEKGTYTPRFLRTSRQAPMAGQEGPSSFDLVAPVNGPNLTPPSVLAPAQVATSRRKFTLGLGLGFVLATAAITLAGMAWNRSIREGPTSVSGRSSPESFYPVLTIEPDNDGNYIDIATTAARIRDAIARFDDLVVVGDVADMAPAGQARPVRPGWSLVLRVTGNMVEAGMIRLNARLLDRTDQRLIWSREFAPFHVGPQGDTARTAIIRTVASAVAQPYGVIHAHVRGLLSTNQAANDPFGCVLAGLDYWLSNDRKSHGEARNCIASRLVQYPTFGPLHAQMTYLHLEEFRHGYNPLPGDPRARAIESAQSAVRFRPTSARSHQSLMAARFALGDLDGAWRAARDALELNPNDTEIIADYGSYRVMAGDFSEGLTHLDNAIALNPSPPTWVVTFKAMAHYMLGSLELSGPMVRSLEGSQYAPAQMALIMAAYQFRDTTAAQRHYGAFRAEQPDVAADPTDLLIRMNFQPAVAARVMKDYRAALEWIRSLPLQTP